MQELIEEKIADPAVLADMEEELDTSLKGVGRSINNYSDRKKDLMQSPICCVKGFVEEACEDLVVEAEQCLTLPNLQNTAGNGWQKGRHRNYVIMLEVRKLQLKEELGVIAQFEKKLDDIGRRSAGRGRGKHFSRGQESLVAETEGAGAGPKRGKGPENAES